MRQFDCKKICNYGSLIKQGYHGMLKSDGTELTCKIYFLQHALFNDLFFEYSANQFDQLNKTGKVKSNLQKEEGRKKYDYVEI